MMTEEEAFKPKPARVEELIPTDYVGRYILVKNTEKDVDEFLEAIEKRYRNG